MAVFNPQIPETKPQDYTRVTNPISDLTADKSTGIALQSAGVGITGATQLADTYTKETIGDDIRGNVEKLQQDTTAVYEQVRNNQTLAQQTPQIPGGLQAGLEKVQGLGQAQAQSGGTGKANDTLYTAALNSYAKQLRSQYPGYRDYIDQKIQQVSGIDPANAYMRNLLQDINQSATSQKGETEKAIALGRQYLGYDPNMPVYIEAVRQNIPGAIQNLEQRINSAASLKVNHDNWKMQVDEKNVGKADDKELATDQFRQGANKLAFNTFNTVLQVPGLTNPQTIQKLIDDQRAGKVSLTDEQWNMLGDQADAYLDRARLQIKNLANSPDTAFARRMGNDLKSQNEFVEDALTPYKQMRDAIRAKDAGLMFGNQRRAQSVQDDSKMQVLSDRDLGQYARTTSAWRSIAGDAWVGQQMAVATRLGIPEKYYNFVEDARRRAQIPDDLRQDGKVKSLYTDITDAQKAKVPQSTRVYDNLVDNVNVIGDAPPPGVTAQQHYNIKKEVVDYVFDPTKNANLLKAFNRDFTDPDGQHHPGKFAVYDTLTQPKIADGIWNMKDRTSWDKYKNWQENSFAQLYRAEVKQLNTITADKSQDVKVIWNSDVSQFELKYPKAVTGVDARYQDTMRESVANLNKGLRNLSYMQGKEGTDTTAYIFDQMLNLGFSPNDRIQGNNLPQKFIEAIAASKKSNRIEDAFSAAKR